MEYTVKFNHNPEPQISILRGIIVAFLLAIFLFFAGILSYFLGQYPVVAYTTQEKIFCPGPIYYQPCTQSISDQCYIHPRNTPVRLCEPD